MTKNDKTTAKKSSAQLAPETMTVALSDGVELVMVRIPGKDYWMGKFPVTQAQWKAVTGTSRRFINDDPTLCDSTCGVDPSSFKGEENPVERVSWDDCQAFLDTLNEQPAVNESGLVFRLPTADEWEFACRAGATGDYCKLADGREITEETLAEVAWFDENSGYQTHPVGRKLPNAFDLYDMHGNVDEWTSTESCDEDDEGLPSWCRHHIGCGGTWEDSASGCGSSCRAKYSHDYQMDTLGFRLCAHGRIKPSSETVTITLPEDVELAMVPIPGKNNWVLSKNYWMGKFPVTQAQWKAIMGETPSNFKGEENPVEEISWNDCQTFVDKLNALPAAKESELVFRLPTVDEWEFACRAGATGDFCKLADGTEITAETLGEVAWFAGNSEKTTHPVGQKQSNAFGLYDMNGNVMEWTVDFDCDEDGECRVHCGGGWFSSAEGCKSSRPWSCRSPDSRSKYLGFRLCASGRAD